MEQDDCGIPHQELWEAMQRARSSGQTYLARTNLSPTDQELLLDQALRLLQRQWQRGRPVRLPEAWIRTVLKHGLGELRSKGLTMTLDGEVLANTPTEPGLRELLEDPWALVAQHETFLVGRLSLREREVYQAVRQGWSLQKCAEELQMSGRDVRTRFRRICQKLDGFLAHLVPPPPLFDVRSHSG